MEANRGVAIREEAKLREVLTEIIKQAAVISLHLIDLEIKREGVSRADGLRGSSQGSQGQV